MKKNKIRRLFAATLTFMILGANLYLTSAAEPAGIFAPTGPSQENLSEEEKMSASGFTADTAAAALEEEEAGEGGFRDDGPAEEADTADTEEDVEAMDRQEPAEDAETGDDAGNAGEGDPGAEGGAAGEDQETAREDNAGSGDTEPPSESVEAEQEEEDVPDTAEEKAVLPEDAGQDAETAVEEPDPEAEPELKELVAEGKGYRVRVIYDAYAQLPERVELVAGEYPKDSEEYIENRQKLIEMLLDEDKAAQARRDAAGVTERKEEAEGAREEENRAEEARREAATEERGDEEPAPQDAQEESPADTPAAKEDMGSAADDAAPKETKPEFDTEKAESGPESAIEEVESKLEPDTEEANSEDTEAEPAGDAATGKAEAVASDEQAGESAEAGGAEPPHSQETAETDEAEPAASEETAGTKPAVSEQTAETEEAEPAASEEATGTDRAESAVPQETVETKPAASKQTVRTDKEEPVVPEEAAGTKSTASEETYRTDEQSETAEKTATEDNAARVTVYEQEAPETEDGFTFDLLRQFDISLVADGREIEPAEAVRVEIELMKVEVEEEISVLHFGEEKTELFEGETAETTISEKPVSSTVAFAMDSFSNVTVWTGATPYTGQSYTVDVDPTNMGTNAYSTAGIASDYPLTQTNGRITLPTMAQVADPTAYYVDRTDQGKGGYRLNGWVDVGSRTWYAPGSEVQVSGNMTFYADWVPTTYDIGTGSNVSGRSVDTDGFVTTHVFDYSDLFNLPYASLVNTPGSGWPGYPGYTPPGRSWNQASGNNLLLFDSTGGNGTLSRMGGRGTNATDHSGNINSAPGWADNYAIGVITPGIGTGTWLSRFFDPDNAMTVMESSQSTSHNDGGVIGKTYVGTGNYLYSYDDISGYYYYDSSKNAASYNKSANRFYVYNYTEQAQPSLGRNESDFLPFNTGRSGQNAYDNTQGQVNYWFGMSTEVDFFLPNDPGSRDPQTNAYGNRSISGDDMVYRFSGDDDVWVYVDDQLVLDMGGVHDVVYGEINFSTGQWMTVQATAEGNGGTGGGLQYDQNGVLSYVSGGRVTRGQLSNTVLAGDHKLKMYYLERGASQSNAAIYFNIAPRYGLELTKWNSDQHSILLPGAEFSVFLDAACTIPASLWDSKQDCDARNPAKNVFTTREDGTFYAYGLIAGYTYYLKETGIPLHYMTESDDPIALRLDNAGNVTLPQGETFVTVERDDAQKELSMHVSNKPGIAVDVEKRWFYEDGSPMEAEDIPGSITVGLYRWPKPAGGGSGGGSGSGSGGSGGQVMPDIRVPVNISTRYFDSVPGGNSNGHNMETGYVKIGDVSVNTTVQYGSKVRFTVNGTGGTAGVYSVLINGRRAEPVSRSNRSTENCYIGGSWGNYPYRTEVYEVDTVTEGLQIQVQLIGYLGYEGSTPLVSRTIGIATEVTPPAQPDPPQPPDPGPGPDPDPGEVEAPGTRPEDAELIDTQVLSSGNGWKYKWEDLEGGYYYYVEELENDILALYDVFYSGNGIETGSVVINNIQKPEPPAIEIEVDKVWSDGNENHPSPEKITVYLLRDEVRTGDSLELHAGNNWHGTFPDLPVQDESGRAYKYEVEEVTVEGYTSAVTGNADDGYVITNTRLYVLPETGAGGTWANTIYGCMLFLLGILLFAGVGWKET